jgi:hypothetical protein
VKHQGEHGKDDPKAKTIDKLNGVDQKKDQAQPKGLSLPIHDNDHPPVMNANQVNVKIAQEDEQKKKKEAALAEWKKSNADENVKITNTKDNPIVVTENVKLTFK